MPLSFPTTTVKKRHTIPRNQSLSDVPLMRPIPRSRAPDSLLASTRNHCSRSPGFTNCSRPEYALRSIFGPICPALHSEKRRRGSRNRSQQSATLKITHLEQLTTAAISGFISDRVLRRGIAPKTANRYREILMRLVSWATSQRCVRMPGGKNPALKVERYLERASQIRFLTIKQIDEQLEALEGDTQLQTMVAFYLYAGLRCEEALWLTVEDVDLNAGKHGMIRVQAKTVPLAKSLRCRPFYKSNNDSELRGVCQNSSLGWDCNAEPFCTLLRSKQLPPLEFARVYPPTVVAGTQRSHHRSAVRIRPPLTVRGLHNDADFKILYAETGKYPFRERTFV